MDPHLLPDPHFSVAASSLRGVPGAFRGVGTPTAVSRRSAPAAELLPGLAFTLCTSLAAFLAASPMLLAYPRSVRANALSMASVSGRGARPSWVRVRVGRHQARERRHLSRRGWGLAPCASAVASASNRVSRCRVVRFVSCWETWHRAEQPVDPPFDLGHPEREWARAPLAARGLFAPLRELRALRFARELGSRRIRGNPVGRGASLTVLAGDRVHGACWRALYD